MLIQISKILMLLKCSSPTQPRLYWSSYWQTTNAPDKMPDYWDRNHGSIYLFTPQSKKVDTISKQVTEKTPGEDYEINIYNRSTEKVFNKNNAEIEKEAKACKTDRVRDFTRTIMPQIEDSEAKSINPNSIYLRALASENNGFTHIQEDIDNHSTFTSKSPIVSTKHSIIVESILRAATPRPYKYDFTRPGYDTTVNDYDAHPSAESDSIIPENIFPKTAPRPEKYHSTRLGLETTVYDYDIDDAHLPYSTIKPKVTKSKKESESNSIITAAKPEKYHFTHLDSENTVYDGDANAAYSTIKPKVTKSTKKTASNSLITDRIFTKTPRGPEKKHYTRVELETTVYDYEIDDAHLPYSTIKPKETKSKEESESNSIITAAKPEKYHFTQLDSENTVYDGDANAAYSTIKRKVKKTTRTAASKSLITDRILKPEKYHFTHLDSENTVYDDDANAAYSTITRKVKKTTRTAASNSLITDRISTKTPQVPEKKHFTRVELETTFYDDYAYPPISIMNPSITKTIKKSDSLTITDDIFTTKAPRVEIYHPEYETITYDKHPTSTTTHTTVIKEELNSIITDNIFTTREPSLEKYHFTHPKRDTKIYDAHPTSTTMRSTELKEKSDSTITDNIFTTREPTPEKYHFTNPKHDTTLYDDDAYQSAIKPSVTESTENFESESTITNTIFKKSPITLRNHYFTRLEYGKVVKYNIDDLYYPVSIMNAKVITSKSKYESKGLSISSSKADHVPPMRKGNQEMETDTFSVFIVKLLIILSVKRIEDFPVLIDQFREYMWMLLKDGQLGELGMLINSFLAKTVIMLEQTQYEELRDLLTKFQKVLADRDHLLPKDINDIIDYMDDTYNKDEEQAMQAILMEASLFPNSRQNNKIAQGLIDYVFLKPMQRLAGTTRGNVLFKMMTEALKVHVCQIVKENHEKINNEIRRRLNFGKTRSHPSKSPDRGSYDVTTLNKLYMRNGRSEGKIDGDIDNSSETSKIFDRSYDSNEHSDETENSEETKESTFYVFKDNDKFVARNNKQYRTFSGAYQLTTKTRKIRKYLSILNNSRYQLKTKLHKLYHNNAPPNKYRRTTTVNSARFIESTDSSNTEMKIKPKINKNVKRDNYRNYIPSRRMRHSFTSTINAPDDSHESDEETVLKSNIYKAMKKLHKTNAEDLST